MITVTDSAVQELKRLRNKYEKEGSEPILRLGVKPSGCSGLSYVMNFEPQFNPDDQTFEFGGIRVAVDPLSMTLIGGITVDFSEDLLGGGFRFKNPNAVASCGCGTSFATSETAVAASH
jgi:iron-sulfur cluster assembly accessory protein